MADPLHGEPPFVFRDASPSDEDAVLEALWVDQMVNFRKSVDQQLEHPRSTSERMRPRLSRWL